MATNEKPPAATPARSWNTAELYRLPGSGNVARLKRPGLLGLAANLGYVPNPISRDVLKFMAATGEAAPKTEDDIIADLQSNAGVYVKVAALAFVEPRLIIDRTPDYDAGEIGPADVHSRDLIWIYWNLIEGAASDLAGFRA